MFEKGMTVYIKSTKHTEKAIGLDGEGDMESMVGKSFEICGFSSHGRPMIRNPRGGFRFTWHPDDLGLAPPKKIKPIVFEFDPDNLDI